MSHRYGILDNNQHTRRTRRRFPSLTVVLALLFAWGLIFYWVAAPPPAVLWLGDSITAQWPALPVLRGGYPNLRRGRHGQTTVELVNRWERDIGAAQPAIVVIEAGTNDLTGGQPAFDIVDRLLDLSARARGKGATILLVSVLPVSRERNAERPLHQIQVINQALAYYAEQAPDVLYVDCYTPLAASDGFLRPEFSDDGLHPNAAGYAQLAQVFAGY